MGVLLLAVFLPVERRAKEPVLPPRLLANRVFVVCSAVSLIVGFALFGAVVYLPLFLQVVKGSSPTESGLALVPLMGGLLITSIGSGQVITRTGRYRVFPIAGTAVTVLGLFLLTRLGLMTSTLTVSLYMFVLGLGLGMVMQVLVLAVQNAVDYADLGAATSGATLFRSIGGSLGTAVLGAIFSSRLTHELTRTIGAAGAARVSSGGVNPAAIHHLAAPLREHYLQSFATALHSVFLVAGIIAIAAFALSWLIPELPLRETVTTGDMSDTFAVPRDSDSLAEIANQIGRLDRREGAREIVRRVAARAGVDLTPAACWLLARYQEDATTDLPALADADQHRRLGARRRARGARCATDSSWPRPARRPPSSSPPPATRRSSGSPPPASGAWPICCATGARRSTRSWPGSSSRSLAPSSSTPPRCASTSLRPHHGADAGRQRVGAGSSGPPC